MQLGSGARGNLLQRMDPKNLTPEQMDQLLKYGRKMKIRTIATGLAMGGIALGIYGYTFFSISQEKFLDELEDEAKVARARYPKTSAN